MSEHIKQVGTNSEGFPIYHVKRQRTDKWVADNVAKTHINESHYDFVLDHSADLYDMATGDMLAKFRKKEMPMDILLAGYENFKHSLAISTNRGDAAGGSKPRGVNKDGSISKVMEAPPVLSGNVGYMDPGGLNRFCRLTAFGRDHFETHFKGGFPFVEYIDKKYKELCPDHHKRQVKTANETNANYVLGNTAFSTITVNKNFRTAVHKDGGDHPDGFGNLFVYREGDWKKGYFVLPEWAIGVDMQNQDMLFVDVHRWHGNEEFEGLDPDSDETLRVSFVLYYRTGLRTCPGPKEELQRIKNKSGGILRL